MKLLYEFTCDNYYTNKNIIMKYFNEGKNVNYESVHSARD